MVQKNIVVLTCTSCDNETDTAGIFVSFDVIENDKRWHYDLCQDCQSYFDITRLLSIGESVTKLGRPKKVIQLAPDTTVQCEVCDGVFKTNSGLMTHKRIKHGTKILAKTSGKGGAGSKGTMEFVAAV